MKRTLLAGLLVLGLVALAKAGTTICSTSTYSGADEAAFPAATLPKVGAWAFDLVITGTPTPTSPSFNSMMVYLQHRGISGGGNYFVTGSTFGVISSTNSSWSATIYPDMYLGGDVRCRWAVTTGSSTIKVTARELTP